MSLARMSSDYNYNGVYEESSLVKIEKAERRLKSKKQLVEDIQNELNLIELQTFETYKNNIYYLTLDQKNFIDECKNWINMYKNKKDKDGNKLDGRKNYKEKDIFDYYINMIKNYLGIDTMDDISFMDYNFGQGTEITFSYSGHYWQLSIPHINAIPLKSYQYMGSEVFKLKIIHQKNNCVWEYVGSTYEEEELKNIMSKGIEKYV